MWMKECFEYFYSGPIRRFCLLTKAMIPILPMTSEMIDGIITPTPNVFDMHPPLLLPDEMSAKYWENEEWLAKTIKLIRTLLDVYVFSDEYDVSQLRRDVMTAILHYCTMFQ